MFSWTTFCETRGIEFDPNVYRENIYIDCPFCEDGQGKRHLGLSTKTQDWGCWKGHSGRKAAYLVSRLLRCSAQEAASIVSDGVWVNQDIETMKRQLLGVAEDARLEPLRPYRLPGDVFPIRDNGGCGAFLRYLEKRRLGMSSVLRYDLQASVEGHYAWRVVIPFYVEGLLVGATGRHIGKSTLRYYTEPAQVTNRVVFGADLARRGDALCVVEGPMDAMLLDSYFQRRSIPCSCVALAGLTFGTEKRDHLARLARNYRKVLLFLDQRAESRSFAIAEQLKPLVRRVRVVPMPEGGKDPGELPEATVLQTLHEHAAD